MEESLECVRCPIPKKTGITVFGAAVAGLLIIVLACGLLLWPILWDCWSSNQQREKLIHESDHQTILAACRELMVTCPGETLHRGDSRFPKAIQDLDPSWVIVDRESVMVELHGGFDHFGVLAFPEGKEGHGAEKLVDGLWYYSE